MSIHTHKSTYMRNQIAESHRCCVFQKERSVLFKIQHSAPSFTTYIAQNLNISMKIMHFSLWTGVYDSSKLN